MKNIFLIGYMCVGKTTVGKELAKQLGLVCYDLDWYIQERFRKNISEIFQEKGEDGFRRIEQTMLHEVAEFENIVLSCGGGTPCFFDNMDYMNRVGTTIFLEASADTIIAHLKMSHTVRPLLLNKSGEELHAYIEKQFEERLPYYSKAQYTFDVNVLDNFQKVSEVTKMITETINSEEDSLPS